VIGRLAVAWLDLTDAARAWWRRQVSRDATPAEDACESCRVDCTNAIAERCEKLKGTKS
jgi:hypothetical protein